MMMKLIFQEVDQKNNKRNLEEQLLTDQIFDGQRACHFHPDKVGEVFSNFHRWNQW